MGRGAYQIKVAFIRLHGEGIHELRLEVACDGRHDPSSDLLV